MNKKNSPTFDLHQSARKFFLSAFVVTAFAAYVAHDHFGAQANPFSASTNGTTTSGVSQSNVQTGATALAGTFKNGTFTGTEVDAYYGLVKVQATIQNGKLTDVTFLEFPQDRRTSQRINSYAVPTLQQEAMQVQSANVDLISGATLTSQAFVASLQSALAAAKN